MRRHLLGSALVIGTLLAGCGVRPMALPTGALAPVQTAAQAVQTTKGVLSAKKVLMPPLTVYKTVDDQQKAFVNFLRQDGHAKTVTFSPVTNTVQISVAGEKAGYFVTLHANALIANPGKPDILAAFIVSYLIDAKGQLSYTHTLTASSADDRKTVKQPTRVMSKKLGDMSLRLPASGALPAEITGKLEKLHDSQQNTIIDAFTGLQMAPLEPEWWNHSACELWYKDQMVGYFDDPAAWMWDGLADQAQAKYGFIVTNVLDTTGGRILSEALAASPTNILGYKTIAL